MKRLIQTYFEAFKGLPPTVWQLSFIFFVNRAGSMVFPFLSIYFVSQLEFSPTQTGFLVSSFGWGSVIGSFVGGALCTRFSPVWVQVVSLSVMGTCFYLLVGLTDPIWIGCILMIAGCSGDAFRPANWVAMTQVCPSHLRARAFGLNRVFINLGWAVGPALAGVLAIQNYNLLFYVNSATGLLCAILCIFIFRNVVLTPKKKNKGDTLIQTARVVLKTPTFIATQVALILSTVVFFQLYTALPVYFKQSLGWNEGQIGILYAINPVMIVLLEVVLLKRVEKALLFKVMSLGVVLIGLSVVGISISTSYFVVMLLIMTMTLGEIYLFPLVSTHVSKIAPESMLGHFMGIHSSVFSLGVVLAPTLGLWIYPYGIHWVGIGSLGFCALALVLLLKLIHDSKSASNESC